MTTKTPNETVEVIFIGDDFYHQSGTIMGALYTPKGNRYDWGLVQQDVKKGKTVTIRPATDAERGKYAMELLKLKSRG